MSAEIFALNSQASPDLEKAERDAAAKVQREAFWRLPFVRRRSGRGKKSIRPSMWVVQDMTYSEGWALGEDYAVAFLNWLRSPNATFGDLTQLGAIISDIIGEYEWAKRSDNGIILGFARTLSYALATPNIKATEIQAYFQKEREQFAIKTARWEAAEKAERQARAKKAAVCRWTKRNRRSGRDA